jgi:hypothetical protein
MSSDYLSAGDALTILLTTETLLFAALALAADLSSPAGGVRSWIIPPRILAFVAIIAHLVVATGAGFAWAQIYIPNFPTHLPDQVIAASLIAAIGIQPFLTLFLGVGLRTRR